MKSKTVIGVIKSSKKEFVRTILNKNILLLFVFFVSFRFSLISQNVEFDKSNFSDRSALKEAKRNIDEADGYFDKSMKEGYHLYGFALPLYLKANDFNPNNGLLNYKIGVCYLNSAYKQKALAFLEKAYKLNPTAGANIKYYMGQAYQMNMDWDKAISKYQEYKMQIKPDDKDGLADAEKKITECRNGIELVKNPVMVFIDNAGPEINSAFPDYGPVISADESVMMFTSRRSNTSGGGIDQNDQQYYEDIYISTGENGKWTPAKNMGKPVNTDNRHDATVAISADGQKMFIYLDDMTRGSGNIYECDLKGASWSRPERLNDNVNTKYHESSASLSADGKTLYFVSNRDGGFGGHDIYKARWDEKKEKWGEAENLGPIVNTPYEEYSVFMHPDGKTLFFSSQGHKTMGGFDVFKTIWDDKKKKWSVPENIGYPINTADDDVDFVLSANGKHGYYASYKADGYGEKDIYMVTFITPKNPVLNTEDNLLASLTEPIKETVIAKEVAVPTAAVSLLKGTIYDELTKKELEADIELVDNQLNQVIATFKSNSATGKYLVSLPAGKNYGIAVKKEGYLFHSENFDIPASASSQEFVKDIPMKNIAVGSKIVLKNIFFDFDKATLRPESTAELERLMKFLTDIPSMKIEISGHTDSKGADDYNMKLSQNRAQSVVDYLASHGIDKSRLTAKGYGETKPIATNDTDEGRQLNRRTEFEILSK
ncbi:MAG: PD40 domain-containing protein [Bacteroidetes bacterium]|nr:PD40 domain-containing protein [Bacteroidota bacterium]